MSEKGTWNNNKYNKESVVKIFLDVGLRIIEPFEYEHNKQFINCLTEEGYRIRTRLRSVLRGEKILIFHQSNPNTIWNIKNIWLPKNASDYLLLSDDNMVFEANKYNLVWTCISKPELKEFTMSWSVFQINKTHPALRHETTKEKYSTKKEDAKIIIDNYLIRTKQYDDWFYNINSAYISKRSKIEFKHNDGYLADMGFSNLHKTNDKLILYRLKNNKYLLNNINITLSKNSFGYKLKLEQDINNTVVSENIKNLSEIKCEFICPEHGEFTSGLAGVLANHASCQKCYNKTYLTVGVGDNHPRWAGGISTISDFLRGVISEWKFDSLKDNNFRCIISDNNKKLIVHHYYKNFSEIIQEIFKTNNIPIHQTISNYTNEELKFLSKECLRLHYKHGLGMVIEESLHIEFHSKYGYGNNTKEQFDEFRKLHNKEDSKDELLLVPP